jgi:cadmium resistance protein CadD (predicted permease)
MPVTVGDLLLAAGVIAVGFLAAVAFYESLSTRDVLVGRALRLARRVTRQSWLVGFVYVATVALGIPVLVIAWTAVLELALFVVGSVDRVTSSAFIAVAIVGATRILAYVREKTAHELAKAIPLAFAFILLTGGALNLEDKLARVADRPDVLGLTDAMILFLVVLEVGLRLVTDGSNALMAAIRRRRGIASDLGVWRTLWGAVRRPADRALADPVEGDDRGDGNGGGSGAGLSTSG